MGTHPIFESDFDCLTDMSFFKSNFQRVLEKCTSNLLLEPDWDGMLQLCDLIRGNDVKAREAVAAIKKTLDVPNPHQQFFGFCVLDTVVKNCGAPVHQEVIKRAFLEQLKEKCQGDQGSQVTGKILEMIQTWGIAGRAKHEFKLAADLYSIMKAEGYSFPEAVADNELIVDAAVAPVWKEGDECFRCKSAFGVITRKHHCRACGNIFCDKCSSKTSTVPKFGIEKEVRVCDSCYAALQTGRQIRSGDEVARAQQQGGKTVTWADDQSWQDDQAAVMERYAQKRNQEQKRAQSSATEDARLKEQEEFELAIALSLDEQEQTKRKTGPAASTEASPPPPTAEPAAPPAPDALPCLSSDNDAELQKYLDRSYWEQRGEKVDAQVKAHLPNAESDETITGDVVATNGIGNQQQQQQSQQFVLQNETSADELAKQDENSKFCGNLSASLDIFMNRMKADQARGKPISSDVTVQTLFKSISGLHPSLLQTMHDLEERRAHWENLSDKVNAIHEARTALDALRAEHKAEMARQAGEQERQRQLQLAAKLELMRQKKREFLESQRAATLARMAESQAAMQAKREATRNIRPPPAMQYQPQYQQQYQPPPPQQQYYQPQPGYEQAAYQQQQQQQEWVQPQVFNQQVQQPQAQQQQQPPIQVHPSQVIYAAPQPPLAEQPMPSMPTVPQHEPAPVQPQQQQQQAAEPVAEAQLISFD